jgi:hypothetical protein
MKIEKSKNVNTGNIETKGGKVHIGDKIYYSYSENEINLDALYREFSTYRKTMLQILYEWGKSVSKDQSKINAQAVFDYSPEEKENFIAYYNKYYHTQPPNNPNRKLSDNVHLYLKQLHDLKVNIDDQKFDKTKVLEKIGHGLNMDSELINLYLKAHWIEHKVDDIPIQKRFWHKTLDLIEDSKSWFENL